MDAPAERAKTPWYAPTEAGVLRISIIATAVVAALGIVFGLLSGSYAIVFDGVYSLADGATSVVALLVASLIANYNASDASNRRLVEKFTMGFWHLEPIALLLNVTGFYQSFDGFQINVYNGLSYFVSSIPKVTSTGIDTDFRWRTPIEGLTLQGGVTYANTRYGDFA